MFWRIFRFEVLYRLRSRGTWICFAVLGLLISRDTLSVHWDDMLAAGRLPKNCSFSIYYVMMYSGFYACLFGAGLMTAPVLRDVDNRTAAYLYSYPFRQRDYLLGKYLASLIGLLVVMSACLLAFVGMAWVAPAIGAARAEDFMPTPWAHLAHAFLLFVIPAVVCLGSIHFALAVLTGHSAPSYVFLVLYLVTMIAVDQVFANDLENKDFFLVLDPIAKTTLDGQVKYWTVAERMSRFLAFSGPLLWNRLLYGGLGFGLLGLTLWRTDLPALLARAKSRRRRVVAGPQTEPHSGPTDFRELAKAPGRPRWLATAIRLGGWETRLVLRNRFVQLMILCGFLPSFLGAWHLGAYSTEPDGNLLPVALDTLPVAGALFFLPALVVLVYATGEVATRERTGRVTPLTDPTPAPTWVTVVAKSVGVLTLCLIMACVPSLAALLAQAAKGFTDAWDIPRHLLNAALRQLPYMVEFAALTGFVHVVVWHRMLGHILSFVAVFSIVILHEFGSLDSHLLFYGMPAEFPHTDFDFRQMIAHESWFISYWMAAAGMLTVLACWLWPRGLRTGLVHRIRRMPARAGLVSVGLFAALFIAFTGTGAFIYHTVYAQNGHRSPDGERAEKARYERVFGDWARRPQPKVERADIHLDLRPRQRAASCSGRLTLRNGGPGRISEILVRAIEHGELTTCRFDAVRSRPLRIDRELNVSVFALPVPLEPGRSVEMGFEVRLRYEGFTNDGYFGTLFENGSYLSDIVPRIGYDRDRELTSFGHRRRFGLPARRPLPPAGDIAGMSRRYSSPDADLVTSACAVETDADQVALASGELVGREVIDGRATYRYEAEATPWPPQFCSARYAVSRSSWSPAMGTAPVSIEVYHLPAHPWNAGRFAEAARFALDEFGREFGLYRASSIRIAEVPNGSVGPTACGNLIVIPERAGWLHDYRRTPPFDWVTFVVGRELARHWWRDRIGPADVAGASLLTEGLPAYAGLWLVARKHGAAGVSQRIGVLADRYLKQRAAEERAEPPLTAADGQEYLEHRAAVGLIGLRNVVGGDAFDKAIRSFFVEYDRPTDLRPTARAFADHLLSESPPEARGVAKQLFDDVASIDIRKGKSVEARVESAAAIGPDAQPAVAALGPLAKGHGPPAKTATRALERIGTSDAEQSILEKGKRP
jgi:ABC-2 type transport system permease protein